MRVRYSNPKNLTFQQLPVKEIVVLDGKRYKDFKNKLRNGYVTQVLTIVDIGESVKTCDKICEIFEGNLCQENLKASPFKKVIEHLFHLKL